MIVGVGQAYGGDGGARVGAIDFGDLLKCVLRGHGFDCPMGKCERVFQSLDHLVLVGQFADCFRVDIGLYTEAAEKEILRRCNVGDLLGEGSYSRKGAVGGGEILFIGGHGFGGSD